MPRGTAMGDAEDLLQAVKGTDAARVKAFPPNDPTLIRTKTPAGRRLPPAGVNGAREVVKVLLQNHASVNVRAAAGHTPLHKAAMNGNVEIAKLLLEGGADVNATDDAGKTPLEYAGEKDHPEVASLLRERGARG